VSHGACAGTGLARRRGRLAAILILALSVMAAGLTSCTNAHQTTRTKTKAKTPSTDSSTTRPRSTEPRSTTTTAPKPAGVYAKDGPYQAGTINLALADGRRVVVWYPADRAAASQPKETFDIAGLLNPDLQAKVPGGLRHQIQYEIDAHPGAKPAARGPFPVVLFSHGYAGFPEQSADLTTHLARWGFVVVAPDHVERSLDGLLGTAARTIAVRLTDQQVLSKSLDLTLAENRRAGSPLEGLVDGDEVAVIGHSAGAVAAYDLAATDRRIKSFISYSVRLDRPAGPVPPRSPEVPGMVMAATSDGIIPLAANRNVYRRMKAPKYLVTIADAGHLVFSDICLIGRRQGGLVSLVHQIGLKIPPDLLKLAGDGCQKGDLDPRKAFPAIDHLSVAFLRSTLNVDPEPVGLDPSIAKAFPAAGITLSHSG